MAKRKFCEIAQMLIISWVAFIRGGNWLEENFSRREFPGWELSRWQFSGWELSWMGIFRVGIVRVGVILGGNCPDGSYPGWKFFLVGVFRVGIVRGESSGWQFPGWEFSCYSNFYFRFQHNCSINIYSNCSWAVFMAKILLKEDYYLEISGILKEIRNKMNVLRQLITT